MWIKVNAELPEATDVVKQAKYIQLRAQEMGLAVTKSAAWRTTKKASKVAALLIVAWLVLAFAMLVTGHPV